MVPLHGISRTGKSIEKDSRPVAVRGLGEGEVGTTPVLTGTGFISESGEDKNVLVPDSDGGCPTLGTF